MLDNLISNRKFLNKNPAPDVFLHPKCRIPLQVFIGAYVAEGRLYMFIMQRLKPEVDIVFDLLNAVLVAKPESTFIKSLLFQYRERGGLSKKQLEGLYHKAAKIASISENRLTTLEAIIKRKPTRYKSAPPAPTPLYTKDEQAGQMLTSILTKYPAHRRVLFLKAKYDNNETLSALELNELKKFNNMIAR